jgi:hypothetical protein
VPGATPSCRIACTITIKNAVTPSRTSPYLAGFMKSPLCNEHVRDVKIYVRHNSLLGDSCAESLSYVNRPSQSPDGRSSRGVGGFRLIIRNVTSTYIKTMNVRCFTSTNLLALFLLRALPEVRVMTQRAQMLTDLGVTSEELSLPLRPQSSG